MPACLGTALCVKKNNFTFLSRRAFSYHTHIHTHTDLLLISPVINLLFSPSFIPLTHPPIDLECNCFLPLSSKLYYLKDFCYCLGILNLEKPVWKHVLYKEKLEECFPKLSLLLIWTLPSLPVSILLCKPHILAFLQLRHHHQGKWNNYPSVLVIASPLG